MPIPHVLCLLLRIVYLFGKSGALQISASDKFTLIKREETTGQTYIGDGTRVRVFDSYMLETQKFNIGDDVNSHGEVTIMEPIYRNGSVSIFICTQSVNLSCFWTETYNETTRRLSLDQNTADYLSLSINSTLNVGDPSITSISCDSTEEYVPNVVYICLSLGYSCHSPLTGNVIEVIKVSLDSNTAYLEPRQRNCRWNRHNDRLHRYKLATSFTYNNYPFFVIIPRWVSTVTANPSMTMDNQAMKNFIYNSTTTIQQVRHTNAGNMTHVTVPVYGGYRFLVYKSVSLFRDNVFNDSLVYMKSDTDYMKNDTDYFMVQHVTMESVVRYTMLATQDGTVATNETANGMSNMELLRSTSMLELDMTPWKFPVPQSQIDAFIVTTRLGSVVAYYTFNSTDEDRKFRRILLGANSDSYQWAETVRFGKQRVLDMWANERYLYVVGENQVRRFDTASCKHKTIADCNHDIECTWCGDLPGNCRQKDACATPANIVNMVNISVSGIQPDVGFVCGGSVVRLMGNNLDLADNISVEVQGKECEIIRDMSTKTSIEVRVPAYHSTGNSTLTVRLPGGRKPEVYPFTYLKCPHIIEPEGHAIKTIRSGGTKLQVSVGDIDGLKDSFFHIIEVAFLFNESVVATTHLRHVGKVDIPSFEFYFPPLVEYVGKRLNLALAAPTYHLIDRPRPTTVLYGSFSNLVVYVERDPVITGIHVGSETTNLLTVAYEARVGKIYLTGKDLETIGESDFHVVIEDVGNCKNIYIMRSNNRISCDLPWSKNFVGREVSYDIIVYIGRNLIYHPGKVRYMKGSRPLPSRLPASTSKRTTTSTDQTSIPPIIKVDTSRSVESSSLLLEILIPCLAVVFGFCACLFMYFRFRKHQGRRNIPDHDFPSVVSYRSNVGVFLGDTRPSFSFQTGSGDNSSMDAFINDSTEDSVRLIIKTMEDEELILKKRDLNIDQLIGRGNFGSVYKGHLSFGDDRKDIAVKTLQRDKPENMDITQFLKEAFVMKNFRHVNVMTLVGVCLDAGDMPLVVLPYMKHGDLLTYLQEERHIPTVKDLVCFGLDIALGMEYLASLKFVHRDLAARNCMLDVNFQVKVADFGLSRDVYETSYYSTRSKGVKLPVKWMSIESLSGGVFNEKTDVWSYGVTLWELMTRGVRPYAAVDNWDMEAYLKSGRRLPQPIYCPANFYKLMRKCWSADPDDRPSFSIVKDWISELLNRVHHYLGDLDQTTNIETTYVNLSMGNQCKYENLGNY